MSNMMSRISLDELLPADCPRNGVYRVQIAAASTLPGTADQVDDDDDESHPTAYAVVTLSDIGLTAKQVRGGLVVWATSIRTAAAAGQHPPPRLFQ